MQIDLRIPVTIDRDNLLAKLAKANTLEEAQDKIIKKYYYILNNNLFLGIINLYCRR